MKVCTGCTKEIEKQFEQNMDFAGQIHYLEGYIKMLEELLYDNAIPIPKFPEESPYSYAGDDDDFPF